MYVCKYAESAAPPLSLSRTPPRDRPTRDKSISVFIFYINCPTILCLIIIITLPSTTNGRQLKRTFKYVYNCSVIIKYIM